VFVMSERGRRRGRVTQFNGLNQRRLNAARCLSCDPTAQLNLQVHSAARSIKTGGTVDQRMSPMEVLQCM
jgi:hypothetical protein